MSEETDRDGHQKRGRKAMSEVWEDQSVSIQGERFPTLLKAFIVIRALVQLEVAEEAGISRQQLQRVVSGKADPSRRFIKLITLACRKLTEERLQAADLFDLGTRPRWIKTVPADWKTRRRPSRRSRPLNVPA